MELVRLIKQRVSRGNSLDPRQLKNLYPVRNENIVVDEGSADGGVVLQAPLQTQLSGFMAAVSRRMKNVPAFKSFALDPVGGFVWGLCDGCTSFGQIAKQLQAHYKMNRMEAEAALASYLQTLNDRKLITLAGKPK